MYMCNVMYVGYNHEYYKLKMQGSQEIQIKFQFHKLLLIYQISVLFVCKHIFKFSFLIASFHYKHDEGYFEIQ